MSPTSAIAQVEDAAYGDGQLTAQNSDLHLDEQEHGYLHAHEELPEDSGLDMSRTVDETLAAWPGSVELPAMQAQAEAWNRRGESWLSDRPAFSVRYQTDRFGDDMGLTEYEAGLSLPLWHWGGRSATRALGDAFTAETGAFQTALRWRVAGEVRRLLWNIALAVNDFELVNQAMATAQSIADKVNRSFELGDVALRDVLMSQSALLEARAQVIEANAALLDAEREFRSVTALDRRPPFQPEVLSELHEVPEQHPALVIIQAELDRVEAELQAASKNFNTSPHLMIGPRRERAPLANDYDESIGITMLVPFGGSSHRDVEITRIARQVATAQAALLEQHRALTLRLHEAAHSLDVVNQNLASAVEHLELAERQQQMGLSAYEKGELDLIDLLKLQESALTAKRNLTWLQIERNRQTAFYNQAVGELP